MIHSRNSSSSHGATPVIAPPREHVPVDIPLVQICTATTDTELHQILDLQQQNLKVNLSAKEAGDEGFVTAVYSFNFLKRMNRSTPHIIAKHLDQVVGYALAASTDVCKEHDLLSDMLRFVNTLSYKGQLLQDKKIIIIGQLCVKKGYRGLGIVQKMFQLYKQSYSSEYDYPVTDIARENTRSMKAFMKTGFDVFSDSSLTFNGVQFDVVLWDWNVTNSKDSIEPASNCENSSANSSASVDASEHGTICLGRGGTNSSHVDGGSSYETALSAD